ncbi:hypothetical protein HDC94_002410 [Leifsonia sp. AK011]|uniref:hypothetical protein n=1 Tax=Leifsonia sp. AK011 TaxID=2723075 RepID=UPI0015C7AC16|nr:hypothetical protein [Leifsonia sp. AK011]NYF11254.1 hypothetical protein [Leifsonia sp. AK011]
MKFWYWILPVTGVALIVLIVYTLIAFAGDGRIFSFAFLANGVLVFPAMIISLAIDQFILMRRRPIGPTRTERVLIAVLVAILVALVTTSLSEDTSFLTVFGWPVLLVVAIATTAVLGVTSARLARAGESSAEDGDLDDLFAGGEN